MVRIIHDRKHCKYRCTLYYRHTYRFLPQSAITLACSPLTSCLSPVYLLMHVDYQIHVYPDCATWIGSAASINPRNIHTSLHAVLICNASARCPTPVLPPRTRKSSSTGTSGERGRPTCASRSCRHAMSAALINHPRHRGVTSDGTGAEKLEREANGQTRKGR